MCYLLVSGTNKFVILKKDCGSVRTDHIHHHCIIFGVIHVFFGTVFRIIDEIYTDLERC